MTSRTTPLVGIIMGSDSDLPALRPATEILDSLGISWELDIVSAHRTPEKLYEYARSAATRGLKVIIAGAGGSAHLPGMTAALTDLPVIGVPVRSKTLDGLDSLLSIVQMPGGVPVATVAIDGGKNAGLLAARILGLVDVELAARLGEYRDTLRTQVLAKAEQLKQSGAQEGDQADIPVSARPDWAGLDGSPGQKA